MGIGTTVATPSGPAVVHLDTGGDPAFLLVATHSAGGGVQAPDLLAVRAVALGLGGAVALVEQSYLVAGRRAPGHPVRQDEAWLAVVAELREQVGDVPLVQCGRSNGARVACRTALKASARAVVALAFPLHPPWNPASSRADELLGAGVPVLVVSGERDPFGIPDAAEGIEVHVLAGEDHELAGNPARIGELVGPWLRQWL